MLNLLDARLRDVLLRRGAVGASLFFARTIVDFVVSGTAERVRRGVRNANAVAVASFGHLRLRQLIRSLGRSPGFAFMAIVPMALGIGAATTVFSVVDSILLRPLPYRAADELYVVGAIDRDTRGIYTISIPNLRDIRERSESFQNLAVVSGGGVTVVTPSGEVERVPVANVTPDFFEVLGATPLLGRFFTDFDPSVVVLSYRGWRRMWNADPEVVGKTVTVNEQPREVVAVLAPEFVPPEALLGSDALLWSPLDVDFPGYDEMRPYGFSQGIGRIRAGTSADQVNAELAVIGHDLYEEFPSANERRDGSAKEFGVSPLRKETLGDVSGRVALLLGAVSMLLAVTVVNVANLFLARGANRQRDLAVRRALGASRIGITATLLFESVAISILGSALGVGLAFAGVHGFVHFGPGDLPRLAEVTVDLRALSFALAVSVLSGVVFGTAPVLRNIRTDVDAVLRNAGRGYSAPSMRWRTALVAFETAMAVVLVTGAGLLLHDLVRLSTVDPGYRTAGIMTMRVGVGTRGYSEEQRLDFYSRLIERAEASPDLSAVSGTIWLPLGSLPVAIAVAAGDEEQPERLPLHTVFPGFFEFLEIPVLQGRVFSRTDGMGSPPVAVVSRTAAQILWGDESPVGQQLTFPERTRGADVVTVIGVVEDIRQESLEGDPGPLIYTAYPQDPWLGSLAVVARYNGEYVAAARALRSALTEVLPGQPPEVIGTLQERVSNSITGPRFYSFLLGSFSVVALILAASGLYATLTFMVAVRRRELGIRLALGARRADVMALVFRHGFAPAVAGVIGGLLLSMYVTDVLGNLLRIVSRTDALTYTIAVVVMLLVAMLASSLPAFRASRTQPLSVLRSD